jgi:hypothetical protein
MEYKELLDLLEDFDEGCELTDAVKRLVESAKMLHGLNYKKEAELLAIIAKGIVIDYYEYIIEYGTTNMYHELDKEIMLKLLGRVK